jgi:hypothetical protein
MRVLSALSCLLAVGAQAGVVPRRSLKTEAGLQGRSFHSAIDETLVQGPEPRALHTRQATSYWLADISKQGIAAFNSNPGSYKVWRNVKDYGAKGQCLRTISSVRV